MSAEVLAALVIGGTIAFVVISNWIKSSVSNVIEDTVRNRVEASKAQRPAKWLLITREDPSHVLTAVTEANTGAASSLTTRKSQTLIACSYQGDDLDTVRAATLRAARSVGDDCRLETT